MPWDNASGFLRYHLTWNKLAMVWKPSVHEQASWLMRKFLRVMRPPSMPRERDQNTSGPFAHHSDSERRLELAFTFQIAHSSDSNWQETAGSLEGDFRCCVKCLMHPLEPCNRIGCRTWMKHVRSTWCVLFHWKCNAFHWEDKKYTQKQSFSSHFFVIPIF